MVPQEELGGTRYFFTKTWVGKNYAPIGVVVSPKIRVTVGCLKPIFHLSDFCTRIARIRVGLSLSVTARSSKLWFWFVRNSFATLLR